MREEIPQFIYEIPGRIFKEEAEFLYSLAKNNEGGVIVEIGSWKGKSTVCLAKGSQAGRKAKVYAIDPHSGTPYHTPEHYGVETTEPEFRENLRKASVEDIVVPLVMKSEKSVQGWDKPIGLLWIDGDHEYPGVKKDFELWLPWVIPGGVVCCHDWQEPGVIKAIKEHISKPGKFSKPRAVGMTLCVVKEINKAPLADRLGLRLVTYASSLPYSLPRPIAKLLLRLYRRGPRWSAMVLKLLSKG